MADFSNCIAIRSIEVSRLPEDSPALAICISNSGKTAGCFARESAKVSPFSTSARTFIRAFCIFLFSVASASIRSASIIVTPARVILANCRQNTDKSLAVGFPPISMLISFVNAFCSVTSSTIRPCAFSSLSTCSSLSASLLPFISFPLLSMATNPQAAMSEPPLSFVIYFTNIFISIDVRFKLYSFRHDFTRR